MNAPVWAIILMGFSVAYIAVCFGVVAKHSGRNPWLWGVLSVISPINLIILGYWAVTRRLPFSRA